jgi:hypothetical protein
MAIEGKPGQCLNLRLTKHCYLALHSTATDIKETTDVDPKTVTEGPREWKAKVVRRDVGKQRLILRLTAKGGRKEVEPPDGGTVTVTLINPTATVPVEVVYVDDDHDTP